MTSPAHLKTHRDLALEALELAQTQRRIREDLLGDTESVNAQLANCNDRIGYALKVAVAHAHLAVAEAIRAALPPAPPTPVLPEPLGDVDIEKIRTLLEAPL